MQLCSILHKFQLYLSKDNKNNIVKGFLFYVPVRLTGAQNARG
jgi:hypothetical protein